MFGFDARVLNPRAPTGTHGGKAKGPTPAEPPSVPSAPAGPSCALHTPITQPQAFPCP